MPRSPSAEPTPRVVDQQSRVRLPPEVLAELEVGPGDYVGFEVSGGEARIFKVRWIADRR